MDGQLVGGPDASLHAGCRDAFFVLATAQNGKFGLAD